MVGVKKIFNKNYLISKKGKLEVEEACKIARKTNKCLVILPQITTTNNKGIIRWTDSIQIQNKHNPYHYHLLHINYQNNNYVHIEGSKIWHYINLMLGIKMMGYSVNLDKNINRKLADSNNNNALMNYRKKMATFTNTPLLEHFDYHTKRDYFDLLYKNKNK